MIDRGSIVLDGDLAKVAEIRTALEARWGEKVQIAEVLTDLLVKDEMDYKVEEFKQELEGMAARDFFKHVWHNVSIERHKAEEAEREDKVRFFNFVQEPSGGHYADEEEVSK